MQSSCTNIQFNTRKKVIVTVHNFIIRHIYSTYHAVVYTLFTMNLVYPDLPDKVVALHDCTGHDDEELSFKQGDLLQVIAKVNDNWSFGSHCDDSRRGLIPMNYVASRIKGSMTTVHVTDFAFHIKFPPSSFIMDSLIYHYTCRQSCSTA